MFPGGKRQSYLEEAGSTGGDKGYMEPNPAGQDAAGSVCREVGMLTCVGGGGQGQQRPGQYLGNTEVNV